jgi:putative toxin-antitoxin system antitoxin component (TIGR02293 family)
LHLRHLCDIFVHMSYKVKHNTKNEVNEPMAMYFTQSSSTSFYNLLGGAKSSNSSSDFDVITLARQGFPKKALLALAKKISLNLQELANILHISERTLQRYEDEAIIKTEYAEKAVELARLYTRGEEVFSSMDKFKTWVKTPSHVFKGEAPVTILDTSAGFDMVFKELGRIEHGIFA